MNDGAQWRILEGDCRDRLGDLPAGSAQTCVTSPPYFGLRDYGTSGQIGLEPTPDEFVTALVEVFRAVRRVLRDDGTVWLNLGDSYATTASGNPQRSFNGQGSDFGRGSFDSSHRDNGRRNRVPEGSKAKDLLGIPWLVAFALRNDGWYLRSDIIWAKPNPMPESVTDRPTKAHEYVFLLSKGPRYFYDADAIREPHEDARVVDGVFTGTGGVNSIDYEPQTQGFNKPDGSLGGVVMKNRQYNPAGRNKRSVWTVATQPYRGAHFATFPPKLIEPCILAGSPEGGTVLDPFTGAGTTGMVALRKDRSFIGCELSPAYAELARDRIIADAPLLNSAAEDTK
jgi:DNA modification methylase